MKEILIGLNEGDVRKFLDWIYENDIMLHQVLYSD